MSRILQMIFLGIFLLIVLGFMIMLFSDVFKDYKAHKTRIIKKDTHSTRQTKNNRNTNKLRVIK
jgi:hypothetical protein